MENKARFKYTLSSFALAFLLQQCGVKRTLARWLMPSPKSKKQICSWQTFVTLCQVSCAETERNGNTKYFVRRNTNNILWCNVNVICQGGTAACWGPVETSQSKAQLEACEVGWLCLLCQLLPQFLWDWWLSQRSQKSLSPEQNICKKKTLSDGPKFPRQVWGRAVHNLWSLCCQAVVEGRQQECCLSTSKSSGDCCSWEKGSQRVPGALPSWGYQTKGHPRSL